MIENYKFSVFPHGYVSKKTNKAVPASNPEGVWTIMDAYEYITSDKAKDATLKLRALTDKDEQRRYKALSFAAATFGGVFSYRNAQGLALGSNMMTIDVDGLHNEDEARIIQELFINDKRITTVLSFVSPSGRGVKAVVIIPNRWKDMKFRDIFTKMCMYFAFEYGIVIDKSGSDICRTCYLPWDEKCFINKEISYNSNKL